MKTAKIFREELNNSAVWKTIVMELGLPADTDAITVKAVSCSSESKHKESNDGENR